MASTYSPLKIELITTGEQSATWGTTTNVNLGTAMEEAITGSADVTFASASITLPLTDTNATQTARNLRLRLTGTTGGARNLIVPNIEKQYLIQNDCADAVTIKNATGTGVAVPPTMSAIVFNDGVNVTSASIYSTSLVTPILAATDAVFINALPVTSGGTGVTTATGTGSVVRATSPTLVTPALGTPASGVLTNATGLPLSTGITGTLGVTNGGTGVTTSTGSGSNVLSTSPTLVTPLLGTPTSGVLTNCTGLPVSTGVSGLGLGVASFLATPSSANLATAVTDETGSGALVFATSPTLVTPALGTPSAAVLTNATGLPLSTGITGTLGVTNGGTGVTTSTGSGSNVLSTSPTLVTPLLGTPTSGTLTNCTGLPVASGVSGLGLGVASFLAIPSSANLAAALTDETGTGSAVFATSPTLVTPNIGTPSAAVLTNATGLPLSTGITGTLGVTNGGTGVTTSTGSGSNVLSTSPTLVTPLLGTPTSGTLTNCTGYTYANLSGTVPTWNQSTTGNAATATSATSATTATNLAGGVANNIPYQSAAGTTVYVAAPTVAGTALTWSGSALSWSAAGGLTGSGSMFENSQTVTSSYTITSGKSAMSAGPITVSSGVTVTIPSGSRWVIL